jgi:hypothetical protein
MTTPNPISDMRLSYRANTRRPGFTIHRTGNADDLARSCVEGPSDTEDEAAVSRILAILASQPVSFALMCALSFAIPFCSLVFGIRH